MSTLNDHERLPYARHDSPRITGLTCNGCLRLEVLEKQTRYGNRERYYCKRVHHGYFNPTTVDDCKHALYSTDGICKPYGFQIRLDSYDRADS